MVESEVASINLRKDAKQRPYDLCAAPLRRPCLAPVALRWRIPCAPMHGVAVPGPRRAAGLVSFGIVRPSRFPRVAAAGCRKVRGT